MAHNTEKMVTGTTPTLNGRKEFNLYLADCLAKQCEWDMLCQSQEFGRMLETLHVLKRHPDQYRSLTGKDPEEAMRRYHKMMNEFGSNV